MRSFKYSMLWFLRIISGIKTETILCSFSLSLTFSVFSVHNAAMRVIDGSDITRAVRDLFVSLGTAPVSLEGVVFSAPGLVEPEQTIAKILDENRELARREKRPLCQDCGVAQVFIKKGTHVAFTGAGTLESLVNEGVRRAWQEGSYRSSVVVHPFERINTGDNTPAVIHIEEVDGADLTVYGMMKGGGTENVSILKMLPPAASRSECAGMVLETLENAGGAGCPPYFVGVGVGGTFDSAPLLAKKALVERRRDDEQLAVLIEERVKELSYGMLGFPGTKAVHAVYTAVAPTHIAMLPLAVTVSCHSFRCGSFSIGDPR